MTHVEIYENEMANKEEMKGRGNKDKIHVALSKEDMKLAIKVRITKEWKSLWNQSLKGRHIYRLLNAPTRTCQVPHGLRIPSHKE